MTESLPPIQAKAVAQLMAAKRPPAASPSSPPDPSDNIQTEPNEPNETERSETEPSQTAPADREHASDDS